MADARRIPGKLVKNQDATPGAGDDAAYACGYNRRPCVCPAY